LIGWGHDPHKLFIGCLIGAGAMLLGGMAEIVLGVAAEAEPRGRREAAVGDPRGVDLRAHWNRDCGCARPVVIQASQERGESMLTSMTRADSAELARTVTELESAEPWAPTPEPAPPLPDPDPIPPGPDPNPLPKPSEPGPDIPPLPEPPQPGPDISPEPEPAPWSDGVRS
jgi:hypothetical protein